MGDLLPLYRDVYIYYELDYATKTNNLEDSKQALIEESVNQARKNLPIGEIVSEQTKTNIMADTLYAITTITVNGIIND